MATLPIQECDQMKTEQTITPNKALSYSIPPSKKDLRIFKKSRPPTRLWFLPLFLVLSHFYARLFIDGEAWIISKAYQGYYAGLHSVGLEPVKTEATIDELLNQAAARYAVPKTLLHAMAHTESQKSPLAFSLKGAIGILQVMPGNAAYCGLPHAGKLWDEAKNIDCGARILASELATRSVPDALRAYNGGPKAVKGKYPESEQYVSKVLSRVGQLALTEG